MPPRPEEDTTGALERARERLYEPDAPLHTRPTLATSDTRALPHGWEEHSFLDVPRRGKRRVRLAGVFFVVAFLFFIISLGAASYFFYFGGNAVSVDKITIDILGPTTIAGGDTALSRSPSQIRIRSRLKTQR